MEQACAFHRQHLNHLRTIHLPQPLQGVLQILVYLVQLHGLQILNQCHLELLPSFSLSNPLEI